MVDVKAERKQEEAFRLKTLAEEKYSSSSLNSSFKYVKRAHRLCPTLDGLSEMFVALKILHVASKSSTTSGPAEDSMKGGGSGLVTPDWYKILQVEPFSHINTIKKQYKKLALTLHPDKNPFAASEEAFKLVGEAFRVLSDKIRRKEYDMKLRIEMQSAATEACGEAVVEAFWTACSTCRLLHQFDRKYLGHNLMCPSCKKSFKAVEVSENVAGGGKDRVPTRTSARIRLKNTEAKQKMSSVGEVLERSRSKKVGVLRYADANGELSGDGVTEGLRSKRLKNANENGGFITGSGKRSRLPDKKKERSSEVLELEKKKLKKGETGEEMMTLAEMQTLAKRKVHEEKMKLKLRDKKEKKEEERERQRASKNETLGSERQRASKEDQNLAVEKSRGPRRWDLEIMAVEDSDFYDFDRDRVERSFKRGQIWAVYDDDDGMPRHYCLIDEVVSVNPFEVKLSWLDLQSNVDERLLSLEKMGFHVSCGRFKISRKTSVTSVNVFSHVVDCERAAREVYRIFPKKGSVWALYKENVLDTLGRNQLLNGKRCYDVVVFLTSYSEMYGLSMAYLEKVDGFKTVFKRREVGCHAIRWLEKDDVQLFSHQIPARKLSGEEAPDLTKDFWELDPASLPPELLTNGRKR